MSAPPMGALTLTLPTAALRDALARVGAVVAKKSTLPALQAVRLTAAVDADGLVRLICYATDLDRAVDTPVVADNPLAIQAQGIGRGEARAFAAPHADLAACVEHAAADTCTLTITGRVAVVVGRARYAVPALPADEVVEFADRDAAGVAGESGGGITAGALARVAKRVTYAASQEVSRPILAGVAILPEMSDDAGGAGLRWIATDGHQGADVYTPGLELAGASGVPGAEDVIVPPSALDVLGAVFDADEIVTLAVRGGVLCLTASGPSGSGRRLRTRLIEGPYPPWRKIVRTASARTITVERAALAAAIRRVAHVAQRDAAGRVTLTLSGDATAPEFEFRAETTDRGEAVDVVPCTDSGASMPPSPFRIACNSTYLADALARTLHGPTVALAFDTPTRAIQLTDPGDPGALALIMPLRLDA